MTCGEFLKFLQDNPDCEIVFERVIQPYDNNSHSRLVQRIDNLECKIEDNKLIIESNPFE